MTALDREAVPVVLDTTKPPPPQPHQEERQSTSHPHGAALFGAKHGVPILNKDTVLQEVDAALGVNKPPAVEYILVRPYAQVRLGFGYGLAFNTYGHAAVRYTRANGQQVLMNVVGDGDKLTFVQFTDPTEYLFGTTFDPSTAQRGIYNRDMISIRVENVPPERIEAMHAYFLALQDKAEHDRARFHIMLGPIFNLLAALSLPIAYRGNCAWWTSNGLNVAGVTPVSTMWPKSIFINIFEQQRSDVHVVSYRRPKHAVLTYGINAQPINAVAPLQSLRSIAYWNLERFANVIVEVPEGEYTAHVHVVDHPSGPSAWRNLLNSKWIIGTSVVISAAIIARQVGLVRSRALARDVSPMRMVLKRREQPLANASTSPASQVKR